MKIVNGWAFPDDDEFMAANIAADGSYQKSHLEAALKHCKQFRTAVDGGAHVGTWSNILGQKFRSVVAFEPSPDTYECLRRNLADLRLVVDMHNKALGDKPGTVKMTLEGFDRAIALKNTGARFVRPGGDIEVITLDSLELGYVDFIKLDVEGSEPAALRGAKETLLRCKPVVLFEDKGLCSRYGEPRDASANILKELGAVFLERIGCDQIWGWR